ncbi:hypothetical protein MCOR27_007812 [Pyricularia oryzae]|uniref:Uncharacterized protein n=4 Tax=Pyricularia TaxID=48558 RepID=A0ABQ8NN35_PYRGI|nr:uncharacterized protein MGG_17519 [Pyricularia oryzae 70-15]ELQ32597.1 hypothetical protein OOU_Y34scaffold01085g7 [Pyricularia oryzae Y34]KAH8841294.1 hypothetical protein MCOR01_007965 [Pyricularia oryzae]KAI6299523.1 hypothetical protein MCOR33_004539 [Pyricularia grisea]EHA49362.1 hypothetical protein MGG_17519 [Pyricularia oryzae 70-15]KAI6255827.1 hypothetical protein MCOR19_007683 [Pyricularia oryzae]
MDVPCHLRSASLTLANVQLSDSRSDSYESRIDGSLFSLRELRQGAADLGLDVLRKYLGSLGLLGARGADVTQLDATHAIQNGCPD